MTVSSFRSTGVATDIVLETSGIRLVSCERAGGEPPRFCCIRPESVRLAPGGLSASSGPNRLSGRLRRVVDLGAQLDLSIEVAPDLLVSAVIASSQSAGLPGIGEEMPLFIAPKDVTLLSS